MELGGLNRPECKDWLIESSLGKSAGPAPGEAYWGSLQGETKGVGPLGAVQWVML